MTWRPNTHQRRAIDCRDPRILVAAGAGSGKTSVLAERFTALVREGVPVDGILVVTFTKKAATEMLDRIRKTLLADGMEAEVRALEYAYISTIDGFCSRVLRAHPFAAGLSSRFAVMDEVEADVCMREAYREAVDEFLRGHGRQADDFLARYTLFDSGSGGNGNSVEEDIRKLYERLRSLGLDGDTLPSPPEIDFSGARESILSAIDDALSTAQSDGTATGQKNAVLLKEAGELVASLEGKDFSSRLPRVKTAARGTFKETYRAFTCTEWPQFEQAYYGKQAIHIYTCFQELLTLFAGIYAREKAAREALDFADLGLKALQLFKAEPAIAAHYRDKFREIMIDEFQDTNRLQCDLFESIGGNRLFRVGDEKQSIYRFRNADVGIIQDLVAAGGDNEVLPLPVNYRSRADILTVVNSVFSADHLLGEKYQPLQAGRETESTGPAVELCLLDASLPVGEARAQEADWVSERIVKLVTEERFDFGDIAILYRSSGGLSIYEKHLRQRGIDYFVTKGKGYYDLAEVADIRSMLRLIDNPRDDVAMLTVLRSPLCGVGDDAIYLLAGITGEPSLWDSLRTAVFRDAPLRTSDRRRIEKLLETVEAYRRNRATGSLSRLIHDITTDAALDTGLLATEAYRALANVRKLARLADDYQSDFGNDLHGFLRLLDSAQSARLSEGEAAMSTEERNSVRLMSIHGAKGLEFPVVFVVDAGSDSKGMSKQPLIVTDGRSSVGLRYRPAGRDDYLPLYDYTPLMSEDEQSSVEEGKRLLYVAMTRAERKLLVSGKAPKPPKDGDEAGPPRSSYIAYLASSFAVGSAGPEEETVAVDGAQVAVTRLPAPAQTAAGESIPAPAMGKTAKGAGELAVPEFLPPGISHAIPRPQLSYSGLDVLRKSPLYFYLRHLLRMDEEVLTQTEAGRFMDAMNRRDYGGNAADLSKQGAAFGTVAHRLLEHLDFSHPSLPSIDELGRTLKAQHTDFGRPEAERLSNLIADFAGSRTFSDAAAADKRYTELPFLYRIGDYPITGNMDLVAVTPDRLLIVDYKTNRLEDRSPAEAVKAYDLQEKVYAGAGLRMVASGLLPILNTQAQVEVRFVFLEAAGQPVSTTYSQGDEVGLAGPIEELIQRYLVPWRFPLDPADPLLLPSP